MTRLNFYVSGWTLSLDDKTLAWVNLACPSFDCIGRRGGEKREKGKGGYLSLFPQSPSLFLFLSIPYPLSTPATQARVNYAAILAGQSKKNTQWILFIKINFLCSQNLTFCDYGFIKSANLATKQSKHSVLAVSTHTQTQRISTVQVITPKEVAWL